MVVVFCCFFFGVITVIIHNAAQRDKATLTMEENKRLGERLKRHNRIHWCFGRSERTGVAVILEEIMANSFPELIKALL